MLIVVKTMKKSVLVLFFVLGLFFLVSPVDTNAAACSTRESYSTCTGSCGNVKADGSQYKCAWRSDSQTCQETNNSCNTSSSGSVPTVNADYATCIGSRGTAPAGYWCAGCGGFCLSSSYTGGGCNNAQQAKCGQAALVGVNSCYCKERVVNTGICLDWDSESTDTQAINQCNTQCPAGGKTCSFGTGAYICPLSTVGACTASTPGAKVFTGDVNGCYCGKVQVDSGTGHTSYSNQCGCGSTTTTTPPPSTPTTTINLPPQNHGATVSCPTATDRLATVTFTWSPVAFASSYYVRIDNLVNSWLANCGVGTPNPGDYCSGFLVKNIYTAKFNPTARIRWAVSAFFNSNTSQGPVTPWQTINIPESCPATPPPPPTTATPYPARCASTTIYSPNWVQISNDQFSNLLPNSKVYFCVQGSTAAGSFTKGRFTINGTRLAETTLVRPGSSQFCSLYTIPSGLYNFSVQGEVFHNSLGWL